MKTHMDGDNGEMKIKPLKIRDIKIGEGIPKICIPITGCTKEEIRKEAEALKELPADMVEWRADWFEEVFDGEKVKEILAGLRKTLGNLPLLFTFRTASEGGEKEAEGAEYERLNQTAVSSGCVDLIDVELFAGDAVVERMIRNAHESGVKVVASNHDFYKTPEKGELIRRLCKMQELGADILKVAVMPQNRQDVLTLLAATEEMNRIYAQRPVVTMSMSEMGMISRLCGQIFGSAITFGSAGKASAPGQMKAEELKTVLTILGK